MKKQSWIRFWALCGVALACMGLSKGDPVPDFSAKNQDGKVVQMSDFKGKPLLIYFYPKDDTPGCTKEACSFRDEYKNLKKKGLSVLGVSTQDSKSHQDFKSKHKLPFDLLVDSDGSLAQKFGIDKMPIIGLLKRQSVLIGRDGKVAQVYKDVDPEKHVAQVSQDLDQLK